MTSQLAISVWLTKQNICILVIIKEEIDYASFHYKLERGGSA